MKEVKVRPKRNYKSSMFAMLYEDKAELLALYNAINGTNYNDPDMLEINTLENAIYMSMKNDVSFIIDTRLELYEHQSTFNPNLPLRDLMYLSDLYSGYTRNMNLYGTKPVLIPTPRFIVFYNGTKEIPDKVELKLSDLYTVKEDILADFLSKNRNEAKKVSIYEYDEQKHMKFVREEAYEEGHLEGEMKMFVLVKQMILNGDADKVQSLGDENLRKEMYEKYSKLTDV